MKKHIIKVFAVIATIIGLMVVAVYAFLNLFRSRYDRPVYSYLPPIAEQYFECAKCNSYDGGIYGKGPLMHYRSATARQCIHNWESITIKTFATEVTTHFYIDWSREAPTWWQVNKSRISE